jgi:hypothetical protein
MSIKEILSQEAVFKERERRVSVNNNLLRYDNKVLSLNDTRSE